MHDWSRIKLKHITFKDNTCGRMEVNFYAGACMVGDPTAYVYRDGKLVWVRNDDQRGWVEA